MTLLLAAAAAVVAGWLWWAGAGPGIDSLPAATSAPRTLNPATTDAAAPRRLLFDLVGHTEGELMSLLNRAKQMAEDAADEPGSLHIALVLHGPDLDFFAKPNYPRFAPLVDMAAQLDAYEVIDFKACSVALSKRGFEPEDVPAFIELVPFGPDEIRRMQAQGFVLL